MKVVFTMTFGERLGGSENFIWTFLRLVDRRRVEPVVVFNRAGTFRDEIRSLGIRTEVIDPGRLRDARTAVIAIRRLARLLRRERPDLIVSWFTKAQLYTAPAAALAGLSGRNSWFQHTLPGGTRLDRVATLLPAIAVGACSHAGAREQRQLRPRRRTFVVSPGIEEPTRLLPREVVAAKGRLGIPPDAPVVGIVGRLQPWKQQHLFIEALSGLRGAGVGAHGLVVGGDAHSVAPAYEPFLRRLASERGLGCSLTFTGHVGDATPYVQLMDVLVNASREEPFGIVLLEAMALGVPVVAMEGSGGPPEVLDDGRCGILASPPDREGLEDAIGRLLGDPGLRKELAVRGRCRYEGSFTAERMVADMVSALTALTRDGDRP